MNETIVLNGKNLAAELNAQTKQKVKEFTLKTGVHPKLDVILVGNNKASYTYVTNKKTACENVGIEASVHHFDADSSTNAVLDLIQTLNSNKNTHGILLQLPLPLGWNALQFIEKIDPKKDVDGLHSYNLGQLLMGREYGFIACTAQGCAYLIKKFIPNIEGKNIVVVGRSILVGKSLAALLSNYDATVTLAHSKTKNLSQITKQADVVVCAIGQANFFDESYFKKDAFVIDVGINHSSTGSLVGDVNFNAVFGKVAGITPVPGGVGPMTVSFLLKNVLKAAEQSII